MIRVVTQQMQRQQHRLQFPRAMAVMTTGSTCMDGMTICTTTATTTRTTTRTRNKYSYNFSGSGGMRTSVVPTIELLTMERMSQQEQRRNFWSFGGKGEKKSEGMDSMAHSSNSNSSISISSSNSNNDIAIDVSDKSEMAATSSSSSSSLLDTADTMSVSGERSVEETLDKLFQESQTMDLSSGIDTAGTSTAVDSLFDPTWWNIADQSIRAVVGVHDVTGLEYGWSIVALTIGIRVALFPLLAMGQRTTSRMAHVQPELQRIKQRYENIVNPTMEEKQQFAQSMRDLFKRYEVKPFMGFVSPLIQAPIFMGMFFGLKKMPLFFHDQLATGGMYWIPDLTVPDSTYILPIACSLSFFATIEMGKEQMTASNPAQGQMMLNVFRGLSLLMVPVCINFHSAMLCYWVTNNTFTMFQVAIFKLPGLKRQLGIWDPPKPVPGQGNNDTSFVKATGNLIKQMQGQPTTEAQKIKLHNEQIENQKMASLAIKQQQHEGGGGRSATTSRRAERRRRVSRRRK